MNIRRFYNQNRKIIWGGIIIIALFYVLMKLLAMDIINNKEVKSTENNRNEIIKNNSKVTEKKSVITNEEVGREQLDNIAEVIDNFIEYCNNKDLEKAYNMLTNKCKEEMFSSIEAFENGYYKDIFNGESKSCNIENWIGNTYRVKMMNDSLSTGKSNEGYAKEDYITIEKEDNNYKLNIKGYIRSRDINKANEKSDIKIEVLSKDIYKDYEKYNIKITNNNQGLVVLGDVSKSDDIYIEDENKVKYSFYNHELTKNKLSIKPGQTKKTTIKFYSGYVSNRDIKRIVFPKLSVIDDQLSEEMVFNIDM